MTSDSIALKTPDLPQLKANVIAPQPKGLYVLAPSEHETPDRANLFIAELEQRWDTSSYAPRRLVEEEE